MLAHTTGQPAARTPPARAAWCMIGVAALGLALAACSEMDAKGSNVRESIGERRALDGDYYLGADPNHQRGSKSGGPA